MAGWFQPSRIAVKLIKALIVFSSFITLITTSVQLWTEYGRDLAAIETRFLLVERGYLDSVAANVWHSDIERLQLLVKGIIESPDFTFAVARGLDGQVMAQIGQDQDDQVIRKTYPLEYTYRGDRHQIGELEVVASLTDVYARAFDRFGVILLSNGVKTFTVAIFLFAFVYWLLAHPLKQFSKYLQGVGFDDRGDPFHVQRHFFSGGGDEIDQLVVSFNEMQAKLFDELKARQIAESELKTAHDLLEERVQERTQKLSDEIAARKRTEAELERHRNHLEELVAKRTAKVEAQAKQMEKSLQREKEYNALQKKFVSLVSHEFRTPLTIIDSTAQRIIRRKDKLTAEEVEDRADKVRAAVTRMVGLIETTLYAARLDEGHVQMNPSPCDVKGIVREICSRHAEMEPARDIKAVFDDFPNRIIADQKLLDEVFTNLLSNAIKYSPKSAPVLVKGGRDGANALIAFIDQGIGIPEDDLPNMFGRFFRAKNVEGINGTGIGLSVAKEFVVLHGGSINVESVEGQGTTFTVRLPIV